MSRRTNAFAVAQSETAAHRVRAEAMPYAPQRPVSAALAEFGAHTACFTSQALGAEWSCFYFIDEQGQPFAFQVHRTPWAVRESYVKHDMARSDPLHPASLVGQNLSFVSVFDRRLRCPLESRRRYWDFLAAFGARDAAEMIFRVGGRAVAGMSLVWVGRAGLRADRQQAEAVQSDGEFNLVAHHGLPLADPVTETTVGLDLTERELEIVQLVCQGLTNARIAQRLEIGLATVKTHLLHVFEKLGVSTRAELVSRCIAGLPGAILR